MKRREFIAGLGAAAWPVVARAQRPERMRRIWVLMPFTESDPEWHRRLQLFRQGFADLG
jgi:hypothetical protein